MVVPPASVSTITSSISALDELQPSALLAGRGLLAPAGAIADGDGAAGRERDAVGGVDQRVQRRLLGEVDDQAQQDVTAARNKCRTSSDIWPLT